MRQFSHFLGFLAVALFLLSVGSVAKADAVDPQVGLGGSGSCFTINQTSTSQTQEGAPTGCIIDITNSIPGATLTSVTITILTPFLGEGLPGNLTCQVYANQSGFGSPSPFSIGTPNAAGDACTFTGPPVNDTNPPITSVLAAVLPPPTGGVGPNGVYGVELGSGGLPFRDPTTGSVLSSLNIRLSATVPEPGTMLLLGTGLVALIASKKRLKAAMHSV
jgi:hypothetical protein